MADYATVTDVEEQWRDLTPAEETRAAVLLRLASAVLRSRVPTLDARLAAGTLDPDLPLLVTVQMVRRRMEQPAAGVKAQQVGPYSVTYADTDANSMWLTADELLLLGQGDTLGRRARSIPLVAGLGWQS